MSERYADKIVKLLRKAESTAPEEAELLTAKAQELMTRYQISEAMIAEREGTGTSEELTEVQLTYTGVYRHALMELGFACAKQNGCRAFYTDARWRTPKEMVVTACGFEGDVRRVEMLNASVQVQLHGALAAWWKGDKTHQLLARRQKFHERREFMFGFASGLSQQLAEARKRATGEAAKDEADRAGVSDREASDSVALVVRSRKDRVDDWYDRTHGRSLRYVVHNYARGSGGARGAGADAGVRADLSSGSDRVRGGAPAALGAA